MKSFVVWCLKSFGLLLLLVSTASANGYGHGYYGAGNYCYPGVSCYTPKHYGGYGYGGYRNQWSGWEYKLWNGTCYYERYHTWYDHCGTPTNYNDGWLYTYVHGCYERHCRIGEYSEKPGLHPGPYVEKFGGNHVGYDPDLYTLVKKYPYLFAPGVLQSKGLPGAVSPQDFLAPAESTAVLRQELAHKESMNAKDAALRIFEKESDREALQEKVRAQLALVTAQGNQEERLMAEIKEIVAVVKSRAKVTADLGSDEAVPVGDPVLARVIQESCLRCHGANKQDGGIDFRQADKFTPDQRYAVFSAVLSGEMPKGGTALSREKVEPFRKWYEEGLLANRR